MASLQLHAALSAVLFLSACGITQQSRDNIDWNDINYIKVACSGVHKSSPGCKGTEDDDLMAIGKSKGR